MTGLKMKKNSNNNLGFSRSKIHRKIEGSRNRKDAGGGVFPTVRRKIQRTQARNGKQHVKRTGLIPNKCDLRLQYDARMAT